MEISPELIQVLTETNSNVKYLRQSFDEHKKEINEKLDEHITEDKRIMREVVKPMYDKYQQQEGAMNISKYIAGVFGGAIALAGGWFIGKHGG